MRKLARHCWSQSRNAARRSEKKRIDYELGQKPKRLSMLQMTLTSIDAAVGVSTVHMLR